MLPSPRVQAPACDRCEHTRSRPAAAATLMAQLAPFRPVFSTPVWRSVLVLVAGTLLASGRRTVCAALRVTGLAQTPHFVTLHRVLNRACWCPRALARLLAPWHGCCCPESWPPSCRAGLW